MSNLCESDLIVGGKYSWECSPEKLEYVGKQGSWHQFKWLDDPKDRPVWCEVLSQDLHMLEETVESIS